ncbi:PREDICTED: haloacid dehalogenase-like hydrolase domain-containing protein At3g48420 isoform X1 [Populus euphratica]|uniref:Haloacid dehalogenase-like hydrolase domain-containing protein At3g48420 isoform X1 n=1 Tax=Populus euphratica TaxID=75702 RepID=A0AAJ6Y2X9_POPEU|nr:PREDICTED: haloacid dehalogenase-like hydrolase domain-containing protein At3g48420 isoform X1 [Populus euphratica]
MEAAASSCSILHPLRSSSNYHSKHYTETPPRNNSSSSCCNNLYLGLPFSSTFLRNYTFPGKFVQQNLFTTFCLTSSSSKQNPSTEFAVLLEVDGVLIDAYRLGNRRAFNVAFQKLGLDCANWTQPIYQDLVRKSDGDEERMLVLFFNRIGWPTSLPTSEKGAFIKGVLREKKNALDEFVASKSSLLRPGVEDFIDDASNKGIPVVILTAYGKSVEKIARSIIDKLGHERISKLKIVGNEEVEKSLYGQLVHHKGILSGTNEELAKEAVKAVSAQKQKIAEEVASMLKLSVSLDSSSSESLQKTVAALRAGAEYAGVSVNNCVLIAGSQSGVAGAEQIGMPCVVLRSSSTSRTQFPSAKATVDGFGGPDLTISKLLEKRWS